MFLYCRTRSSLCLIPFFVLFFLSGISQAQEFIQLTDKYYCGRFGDGKLHVVTINDKGFAIIKKGAAQKFVAIQIASADQRLDNVEEVRQDFRTNGIEPRLIARVDKLLEITGLPPEPIETLEGVRIILGRIKAKLKARRKLLNGWRKAVKKCDNNKFPGITNVYAKITPYYAQGSPDSEVGFLIQVPRISAKQSFIEVCLVAKNVLSSLPDEKERFYSLRTEFISGPFCLGNGLKPADKNGCTGHDASTPGFLTNFYPALSINSGSVLGPPPDSEGIVSEMTLIAGLDFGFRVIPVAAAPGDDCSHFATK